MSSSFLAAAAELACAAAALPDWESLPSPALLSALLQASIAPGGGADVLCAAAQVNHEWREVAMCDAAWAAACGAVGLREHSRAAYARRCSLSAWLDPTVSPVELCYRAAGTDLAAPASPVRRWEGGSCSRGPRRVAVKRSAFPDTSWVFGGQSFCRERDRFAWFEVRVEQMGDECRVGFTNGKAALLRREAFMTYDEPRAWVLSDGSMAVGLHGGGEQLLQNAPRWGVGDAVAVRLDFEANEASWFLNLRGSGATHVFTLEGLPPGELHPAVVLDDAGDAIVFCPLLASDRFSVEGERLLAAWKTRGEETRLVSSISGACEACEEGERDGSSSPASDARSDDEVSMSSLSLDCPGPA